MAKVLNIPIQFLRGTAARWTLVNHVLDAGQPGFETDTGQVKVGDGVQAWNDLPYVGTTGPHAADHQDGGPDEINVNGLSGVLADGQIAASLLTLTGQVIVATAAAPSAGQALVAIDATSASWQSAPAPGAHHETHEDGGTDEISISATQITADTVAAARLGSGSGGSTKFLREDSTWQKVTPGSLEAPYAPGSITVPTENYYLMAEQLSLGASDVFTIEGTGCLRIT
jgi:hypothetical protein